MAFLLGKKLHRHRSPEELVKVALEQIQQLSEQPEQKSAEKASEKASRYIADIKAEMMGDGEQPPSPEECLSVCLEACKQDLPVMLCIKMSAMDFEARKDAAAIFGQILRTEHEGKMLGAEHVLTQQTILVSLMQGYRNSKVALVYGGMLRDCIRHEELARIILTGPLFDLFYEYVELENFEIASDAFQVMRELLTRHKQLVSEFLVENYESFFAK